ncbi:MAG: NADH-quinone oxidoreductase subunit C [Armatimonadota bacterium]
MAVTATELLEQIRAEYEGEVTEAEPTSDADAWVEVPAEDVRGMARFIMDTWAPVHLSTITGVDTGRQIEVLYHFAIDGVGLNVRAVVDKGFDRIDSITPVVPAAVLYEREVAEMLGVEMVGHPDPRRLVLPEDWPEGDYPLRRDERPTEREDEEDNG